MNRRIGQGLCAVLLFAACAAKQKTNEPPIKSLTIEGAKQVSAGEIEDHILTSGPSWWPFAAIPYYDPNAWQADLHRIERFYQARGFYQAQVVDDQVKPQDGGVALLARVEEGKPTRVSRIEFEGLDSVPEEFQPRIRRRLPVRVGQILLETDWSNLKGEVLSRLRDLGYAEAEVGGEVLVETTDQTALVRVVCKPGLRYKFGNIFVASGAHPTVRVAYIIDEAQGAIHKGDWYSDAAMAEAQRRVFKMGVFGAVKVNGGAPDRAHETIPVVIDVRESPFHTIKYGGGVGFDPVRQEYRLISEYTDRNFLGGLRRLTIRAKAGWAFLPAIWETTNGSAPIFDLYGEFEQPRFPGRNFRWLSSLEAYKNLEEAYGYYGFKAKTGIVWQPHTSFSIYPSYNIEVDRITGQTNGLTGNAPSLAYGCSLNPGEDTCYITLSYVEVVLEWDRRDDKLEPRNGWYTSFGVQFGGGPLGGSFSYVRLFPDVRGYYSWKQFTLAGRLRIGTLLAPACNIDPITGVHTPEGCNESPITARFFNGGGNFNRGFGSRRLSPLLAIPNSGPLVPTAPLVGNLGIPEVLGKTVPVGGNGMWDSSIELRYRVVGNLVLAVFLDAAFVTSGSFSFGDVGPLMQYSVGIGLRYLTIVGPLRVDFAYRLNHGGPLRVINNPLQPVRYTSGSECFGIGTGSTTYGGYPEGRCALTISIGEAY